VVSASKETGGLRLGQESMPGDEIQPPGKWRGQMRPKNLESKLKSGCPQGGI
jgi:hypothetical protein